MDFDPIIGNWYEYLDRPESFQVVGIDPGSRNVEIQYFDGALDTVDLDEWYELALEVIEPPEDWTGPIDSLERGELDYADSTLGPQAWPAAAPEIPAEEPGEVEEEPLGEESGPAPAAGARPARPRRRSRPPSPSTTQPPLRLTADQRSCLAEQLRDRLARLKVEIGAELLKSDNEDYARLAGQVHDAEEESVADLLVDVAHAMVDLHINEVRAIEAAQRRIQDGSYGSCTECQGDIGFERLRVYPTAKRCIACQTAHERSATAKRVPTL